MMKTHRAKLFQNGGSQAVRLPRDCRFPEGDTEVVVKRIGRRIILEPAEGVDVLPFDATAAAKFGAIGTAIATSGVPIGQMDTLIAAHALSVNATLVTNNEKHFSKVAQLRVENWR